jgi:non-heme chloroperoxidase
VVLVDVAPEVSGKGGQEIRDFIAGREDFESLDDVVSYAHAGNPLRPRHFLERSLRHNLRHLPGGRLTWKYDRRRFMSAGDRAQVMKDVWDGVENISCPALIVRGGVSRVLSAEAAERLASRIGAELVTVEGAGHIVAGDRPVEFAQALDAFCSRLPATAR